MSTKRYFDILGIPPTRNETLIKKAYRRKAFKYHPDRNPSEAAKDKFIEATEAYNQLLLAIARGENPRKTARSTTHSQSTTYRQTTTQKTTRQRKTASELREERIKEAQKRYEYMKRKEEQENERYFQNITSGKVWRRFKTLMYICTFLAALITIDLLILPTKTQLTSITKRNTTITYGRPENGGTSPVVFANGQKAYLSLHFIRMEETNDLYLERTLFFRDIKQAKIWSDNKWRVYTPDYSLVSTFPLIPLILLIPLFALITKGRTMRFTLLFHTSLYVMPAFLFFLLLSNDRWAHLATLGLLP